MSNESERMTYRLWEVAAMVGVSQRTIMRWEEKGEFPQRLNFKSVRVYDRAEVDLWFQERHRKAG